MASNAFQLEEFVRILDSWGLTDVMLPFLLIFVVIFAILQKSNILGEGKRKYNLVFSLVVGMLVVVPHVTGRYPAGKDIVEIMNNSLPQVALISVAIIMVLILIGLFGGEAKWMGSYLSGWIAIVAFIIVLVIFGGSAGWWGNWSWFNNFFGQQTIAIIVMILVFAIIVWWITGVDGDGDSEAGYSLKKIGDAVGDLFNK